MKNRDLKPLITLILTFVTLFFIINLASIANAGWGYGVDTTPQYSSYNGLDMPTSGMVCPPKGNCDTTTSVLATWVGGYPGAVAAFTQNGIIWNGQSGSSYCTPNCNSGKSIPPQSWGMFYEYCFVCSGNGQQYYGSVLNPPFGWSQTDNIYYTEAVYPAKGEFAYLFTDVTCLFCGSTYAVWVCHTSLANDFNGLLQAINENGVNTGKFGALYVRSIDLYGQQSSSNQRSYGPGTVLNELSPTGDLISLTSTNQFTLGFGIGSGSHYSNGYQLWSGSGTGGLEHFPTDNC